MTLLESRDAVREAEDVARIGIELAEPRIQADSGVLGLLNGVWVVHFR